MIVFNLTIDLALLGSHSNVNNLLREIAKILHVDTGDIVASSVYGSISKYLLGIKTEGDFKKARFLMQKLKNAKLAPIKNVQLRHAERD